MKGSVVLGGQNKTEYTERSVALVVAPYCPHTLGSAYVNGFLREQGVHVIPVDLEYNFSCRHYDLWRTLRAVFNPYSLSELPRVQFVLRPEFLIYSLYEHLSKEPLTGVQAVELELLQRTKPVIEAYSRSLASLDCSTYLFAAWGTNLWFVLLLAKALVANKSSARVVLGGAAVQNPEVIGFVKSLGFVNELITAPDLAGLRRELYQCLALGESASDWTNEGFESLPSPSLVDFPFPGQSVHAYAGRPTGPTRQIPVAGSIGCANKCEFCYDSLTPTLVYRNPSAVVREMQHQIKTTGSNLFVFCDSTFNFCDDWLEELCDRMVVELPVPAYVTFAHCRPQELSFDQLGKMRQAGFLHINLGVESFHGPALRRMHKRTGAGNVVTEVIIESLRQELALSINLISEYKSKGSAEFGEQIAGLWQLAERIHEEIPHPNVEFIVSRLRVDPHSTLFRSSPKESLKPFEIDLPVSLPDDVRRSVAPLLLRWEGSAESDQSQSEFMALHRLARDFSTGKDTYLPEFSLFQPDATFEVVDGVCLMSDEFGRKYVVKNTHTVMRLDDASNQIWRQLADGAVLAELEADYDRSAREFLCSLLAEGCIRVKVPRNAPVLIPQNDGSDGQSHDLIPSFRQDLIHRGNVDGRTILADPLTGSYFACQPLEDAVRCALDRRMSLEELHKRVIESCGCEVDIEQIRDIVEAFRKHHVLEPQLGDLAGPEDLMSIVKRMARALHDRGLANLLPLQIDDLNPQELWEASRRVEQAGTSAVEAVVKVIGAQAEISDDEVICELELACRIGWMRRSFDLEPRRFTRFLKVFYFRIRLWRRGLPMLRPLCFLANRVTLTVLAVIWCTALYSYFNLLPGAEINLLASVELAHLYELMAIIPIVVLCHELAHCLVCMRFGGDVRELGVLVVMGNLLPYVDVSDSWSFSRRRRHLVSLAGSMSDLTVASLCMIIIASWPDLSGFIERVLRIILAVGILSLVINLNPLLRFDGYFILSDLVNVPNLRSKTFLYVAHLVKNVAGRRSTSPLISSRERVVCLVYLLSILCVFAFVLYKSIRV